MRITNLIRARLLLGQKRRIAVKDCLGIAAVSRPTRSAGNKYSAGYAPAPIPLSVGREEWVHNLVFFLDAVKLSSGLFLMTSFGKDVHQQVKRFFTWPMPNGHVAANGSDQGDLLTSSSCEFFLVCSRGSGWRF